MEKITFDRKTDVLIVISSFLIVSLVSYIFFNLSIGIIFLLGMFSFLFFPIAMFFEYLNYKDIYFSKEALIIKNHKITWKDLEIEPTINAKEFFILKIKNIKKKDKLIFKYNTVKSFVLLTLKYCPHDHELYKAVHIYAKEKNIPF